MNLRNLQWPLIITLGLVALVRPVVNIVEWAVGTELAGGSPVIPIGLTVLITVVWVAAVGLRPVARPVVTLVAVGVVYALASTVLSAVLSPILLGRLEGPAAMPLAIIPLVLMNAAWGAIAGVLAMAVQKARGIHQAQLPAGGRVS